ncbi:hypothetical protein Lesp02_51570 [Lentzea sp. NBRC 105346]|uniref:hypothetical protein n=1 Tax=Lentzea sp. NBRC 105346 TaxID=3032205 RepID=UPI0024A0031E|nr:hypothetical protein [Lentzea sp. NBRC 105346]GLZ32969.1 hypothetical protein Lesp02_51570 [Lentzea sp. NBRC 105346]
MLLRKRPDADQMRADAIYQQSRHEHSSLRSVTKRGRHPDVDKALADSINE